MLTAPTLEKLHALKLDALAAAWTEQQHQADLTALGFDERLGLLVETEWLARENKRLGRALQEAKLKLAHACIEAIDYPARRELDKLPERQLIVVSLRDMLGFDSTEVCELLDISTANQRVLLHRGRAAVRQVLEDYLAETAS